MVLLLKVLKYLLPNDICDGMIILICNGSQIPLVLTRVSSIPPDTLSQSKPSFGVYAYSASVYFCSSSFTFLDYYSLFVLISYLVLVNTVFIDFSIPSNSGSLLSVPWSNNSKSFSNFSTFGIYDATYLISLARAVNYFSWILESSVNFST